MAKVLVRIGYKTRRKYIIMADVDTFPVNVATNMRCKELDRLPEPGEVIQLGHSHSFCHADDVEVKLASGEAISFLNNLKTLYFDDEGDRYEKTLKAWDMENEISTEVEEALQAIKKGGNWNEVVYRENYGKTWCRVFIYVNKEMFKLDMVLQKEWENMADDFKVRAGVKTASNSALMNSQEKITMYDFIAWGKTTFSVNEFFQKYPACKVESMEHLQVQRNDKGEIIFHSRGKVVTSMGTLAVFNGF